MPNIDLSILNQRATPAFFADTLANRPAAGFIGRIFVSTDTYAFYRDNGTGWDLIGGPGTGTITGTGVSGQIALWNGASTITGDTGLTYDGTANSLTADKFIVSGGTSSQFLKADGSVDSSSYVPYTGANASLNMGSNNILGQSYFINGDNVSSGGYLGIKQFNGSSSGSNGYTSISALQQNSLYFQFSQTNGTNKTFELSTGLLGTTIRQFQLPNADGIFALTSDILNIYNSNGTLTGERTISLNGNNLIFDGGSSIARVRMDADTNIARIFSFATNNLPRFAIRVDGTESGSNAGSDFGIRRYNDAGTFVDAPLIINRASGQSTFAKKVVIENNAGDQQLQIVSSTAPSLRIDNLQTGATQRIGIGLATTTNNFIQGTTGGELCLFNSSTTASPILFGIYDAGLSNTQEAARISASRNLLVGTTTDSGYKLNVNGTSYFVGGLTFVDRFNSLNGSANRFYRADNAAYTEMYDAGSLAANGFTFNNTNGEGFHFKNGGTTIIRMPSNNNVGIGTTTPTQPLQVQAISNASTISTLGRASDNASRIDFFTNGATSRLFTIALGNSAEFYADANIPMIFSNNGSEKMRLAVSTGNLLINSSIDYGQKLYVGGSAAFSGILSVGAISNNNGLSTNTKLRVCGDGSTNAGASMGSCFAAAGSGSGYDTGISVNMGTSGATMLLMASINTSTGTSTNSAVYIVRFYFDGNNAPTTSYLGGSSDFVTFSVSGNNTLILTASNSGNRSYSWFFNKVEN